MMTVRNPLGYTRGERITLRIIAGLAFAAAALVLAWYGTIVYLVAFR